MKNTFLIFLFGFLAIFQAAAAPPVAPIPTPIPTPIPGVPGKPVALTFVPVMITAPGNYYLPADLVLSPSFIYLGVTAITVKSAGNVVIDMRGRTLSGQIIVTQYIYTTNPNTGLPLTQSFDLPVTGFQFLSSNITILNGTVSGFAYAIHTGEQGSLGGSTVPLTPYISNLLLDGVKFVKGWYGIYLSNVNDSIFRYCSMSDAEQGGFEDFDSQTGNTYTDDSYKNIAGLYLTGPLAADGTSPGAIFSNRPYPADKVK
jgi:hypothetical protein